MEIMRIDEAMPEGYPEVVLREGEPPELVPAHVWQRLEQWVSHRWTPRQVLWMAEGPGAFIPTLAPAEVTKVEIWRGEGWEVVEPPAGPYGPILHDAGPYRVTATVCADNAPPEAVAEAARRLALYMEAEDERPGVASWSVNIGTTISENYRRSPAWMARAIHNSGAADLLRPWRSA
jgi:hypothetical protein